MKSKKSILLSAAVSGLLFGAAATSLTSCASGGENEMATAQRHACKSMNACKGQGGCKTETNACAGKNSCKGQGGCAVPVKH